MTVAPYGRSTTESTIQKIADEFDTYTDDQVWAFINNTDNLPSPEDFNGALFDANDYSGTTTSTEAAYAAQMGRTEAQVAGRVLPKLAVAMRAAGAYFPVAIGAATLYASALEMDIPGQDSIYKLWTGQDYDTSAAPDTGWKWVPTGSGSGFGGFACPTAAGYAKMGWTTGLVTMPDGTQISCPVGSTFSDVAFAGYFMFRSSTHTFFCQTSWYDTPTQQYRNVVVGQTVGSPIIIGTTGGHSCPSDDDTYYWIASEKQLLDSVHLRDGDADTYNSTTNKYIYNYTPPADLGSTDDKSAARAAIRPAGTAADDLTDAQKAAITSAVAKTEPTWAPPPDVFTLPSPQPNETYTAYIARLQAAGWVGTATTVAEPTALDGYGPDAVTRVQVSTLTTSVYDPLHWPGTDPSIDTDVDITVRYNPDTATPAPTDTGGSGGIDFTPITGIDFGCKFPFGFVCYAADVTGWFSVTPAAPDFDMTLPSVTVAGQTYDVGTHYDVNLNVMDDYMVTFRTILAVVLWIGGVYMLATRFLGLQLGDPGEAIDDGLE